MTRQYSITRLLSTLSVVLIFVSTFMTDVGPVIPSFYPGNAQNVQDNVSTASKSNITELGAQRSSLFQEDGNQKGVDTDEANTNRGVEAKANDDHDPDSRKYASKEYNLPKHNVSRNNEVVSPSNERSLSMRVHSQGVVGAECNGTLLLKNRYSQDNGESAHKDITKENKTGDLISRNNVTESECWPISCNRTEYFESNSTSSNPVSNQDAELDKQLTFTCRGKCGDHWSFPCSCSELCVLYNSCCENITKDCPGVVQQGRELFASYLGAKIECGVDTVYRISSCPSKTPTGQQLNGQDKPTATKSFRQEKITLVRNDSTKVNDTDETNEENQTNATHQQQVPVENIVLMINNAPVTDIITGITYANISIRDCYLGSNTRKKYLSWGLRFEHSGESQTGLQSLKLVRSNMIYKPLFGTEILGDHVCQRNVIDKCGDSTSYSEIHSDVKRLCEEFTGLVSSKVTDRTYRNRFCAYCHEGPNKALYLHTWNSFNGIRTVRLEVIVSLTASGNFFLQVEFPSYARVHSSTWTTAVCPSPESYKNFEDHQLLGLDGRETESDNLDRGVTEDSLSRCQVTCDSHGAILHSDWRCKARHTALVAFGDDGLPPLCESALSRVASFISCGLKLLLKDRSMLHAEFQDPTVSVGDDLRTKKRLYIIKLIMDIPDYVNGIFSYDRTRAVENVAQVAITLKAIREYRMLQDSLCDNDGSLRTFVVESAKLDEHILSSASIFMDFNMSQLMSSVRGPLITGPKVTTLCVSSTRLEPAEDLQLLCLEDFDYERDEENVRQLLTSKCGVYLQHPYIEASGLEDKNTRINKLFPLFIVVVGFNLLR